MVTSWLPDIQDLSVLHTRRFCVASSLWQRYLLVYKDSKCYVENSFAYAPEMTMDTRDKTTAAIANFWVCAKF